MCEPNRTRNNDSLRLRRSSLWAIERRTDRYYTARPMFKQSKRYPKMSLENKTFEICVIIRIKVIFV